MLSIKMTNKRDIINNKLNQLHNNLIENRLDINKLQQYAQTIRKLHLKKVTIEDTVIESKHPSIPKVSIIIVSLFMCLLVATQLQDLSTSFYGVRCLVPNNYLIWEATRPISDCQFCNGVDRPILLYNTTRATFKEYAYTSKPIIVKGAGSHWPALQLFDYNLFKQLYKNTDGAYKSAEEECQFLNFKSDIFSLREVFEMSDERARYEVGQEPWYVGWGNCHPKILETMRKYYTFPEFLPSDAEFPNTENIFFGYEKGAVMHLDYIPRLMWQGQVKGNKSWSLVPIPECDHICKPFQFTVEPGDIVLLDTRVWYHATTVPQRQFSLTVQSEYG